MNEVTLPVEDEDHAGARVVAILRAAAAAGIQVKVSYDGQSLIVRGDADTETLTRLGDED